MFHSYHKSSAYDGLNWFVIDGRTVLHRRDNQGSVRLVVDAATGVVAQRLDYDSFGRVIRDTNPGFQPFGFQGGLYDPDTGLVEFCCRWYDAQTGRWISKDPILLDGGWNVYAFCDNDPVNRTDPSGLCENERGGISDKFIVTPSGYRIQYPANVDIMKNIEMAKSSWSPFWFRNQVKNKGPWDFKQQGQQYENFGNFHYGVVGRAFGFSETVLLREAGRAQQAAGTSLSEWGSPGWRINPWGGSGAYGDDPADQKMIKEGIRYFDDGLYRYRNGSNILFVR